MRGHAMPGSESAVQAWDCVLHAGRGRVPHLPASSAGQKPIFVIMTLYIECILISKNITFFFTVLWKVSPSFHVSEDLGQVGTNEDGEVAVMRCFLTWSSLFRQSTDACLSIPLPVVTQWRGTVSAPEGLRQHAGFGLMLCYSNPRHPIPGLYF